MRLNPTIIKTALKRYYLVPLDIPFRQFRNGLIYFAVGMTSIMMASANLPSSISQELVVFFGLALTTIGFVMAILAQTRMLISRIVQFFVRK